MTHGSLLETQQGLTGVATTMSEARDGSRRQQLGDAILRTLAYAAVFDFAMTRDELHRYLIGMACRPEELHSLLDGDPRLARQTVSHGSLVTLRGREALIAMRADRDATTARQWPTARRYARAVASLPFVRMVAVTGGLAAGNAVDRGDIDLLVVTRAGRLWMSRASTIAIVRYAARRGWDVCPNYFLTQRAVSLTDQDLYAASELVRMVPISGGRVYQRMRARNRWTEGFFPNAHGSPRGAVELAPVMPRLRVAAEWVMSLPPMGVIEDWERRRKVNRFQVQAIAAGIALEETSFGVDQCKGHFDAHRSRIRAAYQANARAAGVEPIW
jgi:hypothetical protein